MPALLVNYEHLFVADRVLSTNILTEDETDQLFSSSGWIGLFGMEIFALCYACSTTKTEAKQIGWNLHRYAMECDSARCKIKVFHHKDCIQIKYIDISRHCQF